MIVIVLVSSNQQLTQGVKQLINQMYQGLVPLILLERENQPEKLAEFILSVDQGDGVLFLLDNEEEMADVEQDLEYLLSSNTALKLYKTSLIEGSLAAAAAVFAQVNLEKILPHITHTLELKNNLFKTTPETPKITPINSQAETHEKNQTHAAIPASPGIAIGPVFICQSLLNSEQQTNTESPEEEWHKLQQAILAIKQELIDSHTDYLDNPIVLENIRRLIFKEQKNAIFAWQSVLEESLYDYQITKDSFRNLSDIENLSQRLLNLLMGSEYQNEQLDEPVIIIAPDFSHNQTSHLDLKKVLGICTSIGGITSHAAILARSLRIPAVMGIGEELLKLSQGTVIALNGDTGQIWINPEPVLIAQLQQQMQQQNQLDYYNFNSAQTNQSTITKDGLRISVLATAGTLEDAKLAASVGAEGIGLLRSEFIYFPTNYPPSETEQITIYQQFAQAINPYPLIIRILDVGGDKSLTYLPSQPEKNPVLGLRGMRLLWRYPDLLKTQMRAILQASSEYPIKILFPMISELQEIKKAKKIFSQTIEELQQAGLPYNPKLQLGIMIETPAAVIMAEQLATEVDFFSIGTNDLTQYIMAADRNNIKVADLADAFSPAVLRMIQQTVKVAKSANIWVEVCGELASSPLAVPILLGLGIENFSVNVPAIGLIKKVISQLTKTEAEIIAEDVLELSSACAVKEYVAPLVSI